MTLELRTDSVEATRALAARLGELVEEGDVILLAGDLGAGKTAFAQGFGRAIGVDEAITSPTFTLARQYEGRLLMHHLDVYRLDRMHELFDVGLPEMLDEEAVVLIEWGDAISPALPADYLEIRLRFGPGDDDRILEVRGVGDRWRARWDRVDSTLAPWRSGSGGVGSC